MGEVSELGKRLIKGDLSCDEYLAALDDEQRWEGDMRLLVDILGIRKRPARELSPKELLTLEAAANGLTYKQIAEKENVAEDTIKSRIDNCRHKLCARNVTHAVAIAVSRGLIGNKERRAA